MTNTPQTPEVLVPDDKIHMKTGRSPLVQERRKLEAHLPKKLTSLSNPQTALPSIANDPKLTSLIENAVQQVPTSHALCLQDARAPWNLEPESIHLVLTSPPY